MKRYIITLMLAVLFMPAVYAQSNASIKTGGKLSSDVKWSFDGYTLTITNTNKNGQIVEIPNYDMKTNVAPWVKKNLNVRKVDVGIGVYRIGSCAFANCTQLQEVVFTGNIISEIGWGAFYNCSRLRTISLPVSLTSIESIAFANCKSLPSVKIGERCRVGDQAFVSCSNLKSIEVGQTTILGSYVFASEVQVGNAVRHKLYNGEINKIPSYVNTANSRGYGISQSAVGKCIDRNKGMGTEDYDAITSDVDKDIPLGVLPRNDTYALVIGNQNYRFVGNVPYAIHDARVFGEYCKRTLGLPVENIHVVEDATKEMILEEEIEDWLTMIPERENKKLIVYYAGHGVPDIRNHNKAYILPTDVRGTNPKRGIALDDFYDRLSKLAFNQTSVFMDACFSGINRNDEGVAEGLRGVEIEAEETPLSEGVIMAFSAAQGNETAQGLKEEGHGLFTYYLLKELKESNGYVSLGILTDNVKDNVSKKALQLKLRKKQTPTANPSSSIADRWRSLVL